MNSVGMNPSWTAPAVERTEPVLIAAERASLESWLDFHRSTLLVKCAGLSAEQLKARPAAPSTLSLLGLVRHMADVEYWWFSMHAAGAAADRGYETDDDPDADFNDTLGADAAGDLARFRREIERSRACVAGLDLDTVVPSRGDHPERIRDVRWIYQHMIEEYARHNGHADLIREQIDGVTGS
jgi:uncharacterized damage-inducible protein DinB